MALIIFLTAIMLSLVLVPPLIKLGHRYNFIDVPGERKVHSLAIPRIGGLAMVIGAILPLLIWLPLTNNLVGYLLGVIVITIFGVWDDRYNLDYRLKFAGQFLAAGIVVVYGDAVIRSIPFGPADGLPDFIGYPLTIIFLVGITNAINLADGLDGLAAGVALLSLSVVGLLAHLADGVMLLFLALSVGGGIIGFLRYNTHPAQIFMGDTGSQFLGYSLGVATVFLTQKTNTALSPVLLILILGLPILDTANVMFQRIRAGRSPFSPDKNHLHHKLLASGMDHYEAVTAIYLLQGLFVGSALFLRYETDIFLIALYFSACVAVFMFIAVVGRMRGKSPEAPPRSRFSKLISRVRRHKLVVTLPRRFIYYSVPAFLVLGSILLMRVPRDFSILASAICVFLMMRLVFGYKLWFFSLRLMVFVSIAFVVYLLEDLPPVDREALVAFDYVFFSLLSLALIMMIRSRLVGEFKLTPTDFLLMLSLLSLGVLPDTLLQSYHLINIVIKLVILFYCSEMILKVMPSRWSLLPIASLMSLAILSLRGVF